VGAELAARLAARLLEAEHAGRLLEPLTAEHPDLSVEDAYRIQDEVLGRRRAGGEEVIGAKLGLTSMAKQQEMRVGEPLFGWLTDAMILDVGQPLERASLVQPRAEPEIAFLMGSDLAGAGVGAAHVLAATRAVAPGIEILDSRYADYRFTLPDVVADNASSGRFLLGGVTVPPDGVDLRLVGCVLEKDGEVIATAAGAASLGHPAAAVAWLVRALARSGRGLRAGDVVLSGGLTTAIPIEPGNVVTARFDRLGTVEVACR
jgi:2-oxopent-4-enoate hydratase